MAYTNLPPNLYDYFSTINQRIRKLESAPDQAMTTAESAQSLALTAQSLALTSQSVATNAQVQAINAGIQANNAASQATLASSPLNCYCTYGEMKTVARRERAQDKNRIMTAILRPVFKTRMMTSKIAGNSMPIITSLVPI